MLGGESPHQHLANELFWTDTRELLVKGQDQNGVDPHRLDQFESAFQRSEHCRRTTQHHLFRMSGESDHRRGSREFFTPSQQIIHQRGMSTMKAIEETDGAHRTPRWIIGQRLETAKDLQVRPSCLSH